MAVRRRRLLDALGDQSDHADHLPVQPLGGALPAAAAHAAAGAALSGLRTRSSRGPRRTPRTRPTARPRAPADADAPRWTRSRSAGPPSWPAPDASALRAPAPHGSSDPRRPARRPQDRARCNRCSDRRTWRVPSVRCGGDGSLTLRGPPRIGPDRPRRTLAALPEPSRPTQSPAPAGPRLLGAALGGRRAP